MSKIRIAVLGLHHDHVWSNLEELSQFEAAELVGAADPFPELRERYAARYGGPTYECHDELLEELGDGVDAAFVFGSNRLSEDLTVSACGRGLHCLVEKPMASSLEGADRMLAAAGEAGVRLMIGWPFNWWPQLQHAMALAVQGEIGHLWQVKYRAAHQGPVELGCSKYFCDWLYDENRNGAGALMDYCCYGAVLAQAMLGSPAAVSGVILNTGLKPDLTLEDNAILVMTYPHALATSEASWTQIGQLTAYTTVFYGSEGTLMVEPRHDGRLLKATLDRPDGVEIPVPPVPANLKNASAHFLHLIEHPDVPAHPLADARTCRNAQEILEAGLLAAREGRMVELPVFATDRR